MKNIFILFCKKHDSIRKKLFSKLNIDVTTLIANSEMTSSIFTKLMNPDNKTDTKDVCNLFIHPSRDGSYYVIGYGGRVSTQVSAQ